MGIGTKRGLSDGLRALLAQRRLLVGFVAQLLQYGAALLLLPFMAATLSMAEISIWYLLITIQGLAAIADFGFGGTFARSIATAFAGADSIQSKGFDANRADGPNHGLIIDIIHAARLWYALLGTAIFVLLMTAGLAYALNVTAGSRLDPTYVAFSWCTMAFGTALSMYFSWVNPILIGADRIEQDLISQIVGKGGAAVFGIAVLICGGGLLALAFAQLLALVAGRVSAAIFLRPVSRALPDRSRDHARSRALLRVIAPNATRFGLASLSGFLITRSSVFAVTSFVGLSAGGSYAISLQLMSAVLQISQLPAQFTMPRLVAMQSAGDKRAVRRSALRISGLFVALFLLGLASIVVIAPSLFAAIGRNVVLLPVELLTFLGAVMLLEGLHSVSAFVLMTANKVPFTRAAILSAIAVAGGTMFAGWRDWGIGGIVAVQALVQLSYNNWRWPLMVFQDTRDDFRG